MSEKLLTYVGPFEGSGAFPTINRQMTAALERRGWRVLRNQHNEGAALAPYLVSCTYPPQVPNIRHERNVLCTTWEFVGPGATPRSFLEVMRSYDVVWSHCKQAGQVFEQDGTQNVVYGYHGVDPLEMNPTGSTTAYDMWSLLALPDDITYTPKIVLWVGGTDQRHGFDLAVQTLDHLPFDWFLVAKQSVHYPPAAAEHPRLRIVRQDLPSIALLYRSADVLLHSARATGPGMTVIEALACGLPVVSTDLPAVRETTDYEMVRPYVQLVPGRQERMVHHIHHDCLPQWFVPDPKELADAILRSPRWMNPEAARQYGRLWAWHDAAHWLECALLGNY